MSTVVPRTCTELRDEGAGDDGDVRMLLGETKALTEFRLTPAYVLLGDPGAGKTTEFRKECQALGSAAVYLTARKFINPGLIDNSELQHRTLYIDGLDEMRVGTKDRRVPLDAIRGRLRQLGQPHFRISCREADWLGPNDRQNLADVSRDSRITVLKLDELNDRDITALLRDRYNQSEPQAFISKARQHGVGGLLVNPLTLRLLVEAVRQGGNWPDSRLSTLEMACRQIATEHNDEHRFVTPQPALQTVVDASGYLCALLLLSGVEVYSLDGGTRPDSLVSLTELAEAPGNLSRDDLRHALGTKLFTAPSEGLSAPIHRQVAEFLAGRHLAKLIRLGLPARRVVDLMRGKTDRRVVTSLRGLSAWLAAHSREARPMMIDADPVGVGLYGDIGDLTTHEKKQLLESLSMYAAEASLLGHERQDGRSYGYRDDTAWAFRSLATADMVLTMRELLSRPGGKPADDRLATLILGTLSHADDPQSVADVKEALEPILWSEAGSTQIRELALDAYLHIAAPSDDRTRVLRLLLDAIQDGSVPDPDDEVRGTLLENLYPEAITPTEVWRYALPRNHDLIGGRFWRFWNQTLLEESSDQHLAELLDSLHEDASHVVPALEQSNLDALPAELLARCLEAFGDNYEPARLYGWLATAGRSVDYSLQVEEPARKVRGWLESHPPVQQETFLTWLRQSDPGDLPHRGGYWFCDALHDTTPPPDFGLWCLDQAIELVGTEPAVSRALLWQAWSSLDEPRLNEGLTLETTHERTRRHPELAQYLDELCAPRSSSTASIVDERRRNVEALRRQRDEDRRKRRDDWATTLSEQEADLWENRFSPPNLHTLATVYLGLGVGVDRHSSPRKRIGGFIGGDPRLVDAVMAALRGAVSRDDLPEVDQTISWSLEAKHSWLAFPVLASLKLLDNGDPARLDALQEAPKRKALATYYCVPRGAEPPPWHNRWLQQDPELVLDVLYRCAVAAVRASKEFPPGLNELDGAEGHDDLVHEVRLRLLEAFPTRSSNKQMSVLDRLLSKALDHSNQEALLALSKRKQALTSMPIAQRIRWWATDALVAQGTRLHELKADLAERDVRVRHLAEFLRCVWDRHGSRSSILATIRDPSTLREMIEILGRWCAAPQYASGFVTLEMEMSELISRLIGQLGSEPGDEAQQALARLVEDPELEGWHAHLTWAQQGQRVVHRDASYSHPDIDQVQDTLNDGPPADAADLRALLEARLNDICAYLRGGSSDFWRQFWNEDPHGRPTGAKPEDSCRDALLTNLQFRLPGAVDAAREGSYAADTKSDIRVSYGGFNVPIEIKKDSHRDLWRAMRGQLMAQYTTDPATEGYGIYLVLWFADADKPASRHPDGIRPGSPEELRRRLEQDLTVDEARKIAVIVMDVTKPGEPPR